MRNKFAWKLVRILILVWPGAILSLTATGQVQEQTIQNTDQNANTKSEPKGGSSTAGIFAPVYDSEHRPITAGGFVKTGPVIFEDISAKSKLTSWHHTMGTPQKKYIWKKRVPAFAFWTTITTAGWISIW